MKPIERYPATEIWWVPHFYIRVTQSMRLSLTICQNPSVINKSRNDTMKNKINSTQDVIPFQIMTTILSKTLWYDGDDQFLCNFSKLFWIVAHYYFGNKRWIYIYIYGLSHILYAFISVSWNVNLFQWKVPLQPCIYKFGFQTIVP